MRAANLFWVFIAGGIACGLAGSFARVWQLGVLALLCTIAATAVAMLDARRVNK